MHAGLIGGSGGDGEPKSLLLGSCQFNRIWSGVFRSQEPHGAIGLERSRIGGVWDTSHITTCSFVLQKSDQIKSNLETAVLECICSI